MPTLQALVPAGFDSYSQQQLKQEVQVQASLSHVNVVALRSVVLTRRHLGLVMDCAEGRNVHGWLQVLQCKLKSYSLLVWW